MSTLRVDNLNARTGTTISVPAGTKMYIPGHIINVYNVVKTDVFTTTSTTPVAITGLSLTVTPTSASSKFLVSYSIPVGIQAGAYSAYLRLRRAGTNILLSDQVSTRNRSSSYVWSDYYGYQMQEANKTYLDSPATTSAITYDMTFATPYGTSVFINRSYEFADSTNYGTAVSTLTVLEVGL